jgi:hypothetical protein
MEKVFPIEVLHTWASPQVAEYVEALKEDVRRCFTVPTWMMQRPDMYARHYREACRVSEVMRVEILKLTLMYCTATLILDKEVTNESL